MCVSSRWTEEHTRLQRVQTGTSFMSSHLQTEEGEDVSSTHLQGAPVSVSVVRLWPPSSTFMSQMS